MNTLLLVDGNSIINRAFYGNKSSLTSPDGRPIHAVYTFLNMYYRFLNELNPDHVCIAFDVKGPTFRHTMYDDYKGKRKPTPEDLVHQIKILKDILPKMGIKTIEKKGFEADDLLGSLSKQFSQKHGCKVYIFTGDKDDFQLIDDLITILVPETGGGAAFYDTAALFDRYKCTPKQFIDLKAIMGDPSDNIPGVKGIGEKGATDLISVYGNLDTIYEHLDEIKPAMQKKLEENKTMAYLSYDLSKIKTDIPIDFDYSDCAVPLVEETETREIFRELGFRSLLDKLKSEPILLQKLSIQPLDWTALDGKDCIYGYFHEAEQRLYCMSETKCFVLNLDESLVLLNRLKERGAKLCLFETKPLLKALGWFDYSAYVDVQTCFYALGLLDSYDHPFDLYVNVVRDHRLSIDLVEAVRATKEEYLYFEYFKILEYLLGFVQEKIKVNGVEALVYDMDLPLIAVLARMETTGIAVNLDILKSMEGSLKAKLFELTQSIYDLSGREFNIQSSQQMSEVLYTDLGLKPGKKNKSGVYSVAVDELERLKYDHEIIGDILKYRSIAKLLSTYVIGLQKTVLADGRIHTTFNQNLTATGRLSSIEPNLQNIPIRLPEGRLVRKAFVAKPGYVLLDADYSQIELRLLAHLSQDENMIQAFKENKDIHINTACQIFHVEPEDVTSRMRSAAKTINFSIIYGISAFSLSKDLEITTKEAQTYIEKYYAQYPRVSQYMAAQIGMGYEQGFVETYYGRRRYIHELKSSNRNIKNFGERIAMNTPVQGTAADIIRLAMIRIDQIIQDNNWDARLVLQVHDELVIEVNEAVAAIVSDALSKAMTEVVRLDVPLIADVYQAKDWYSVKG